MKVEFVNLKEVSNSLQMEVRNWRNAQYITKFFQIPHINEKTHKNWLLSLHEDKPSNIAFLIKVNDKFVGLAYFLKIDYFNKIGEWGIFMKDEFSGKGLGAYIEYKMHEMAFEKLGLYKLNISVLENNQSIIQMHQKFAYKIEGVLKKNIVKDENRLDVYLLGLFAEEWMVKKEELKHLLNRYEVSL